MTRNIDEDYRRAYEAEAEGYRRAGRTEDAEAIEAILRDRYGVKQQAPETAEADPAPERATEAAPVRKRARKTT